MRSHLISISCQRCFAVELLLNIILDKDDTKVTGFETQRVIIGRGLRSNRMDIHTVDSDGKPIRSYTRRFGLVKDGILSVSDAAKRANINVADFEKAYKMFLL